MLEIHPAHDVTVALQATWALAAPVALAAVPPGRATEQPGLDGIRADTARFDRPLAARRRADARAASAPAANKVPARARNGGRAMTAVRRGRRGEHREPRQPGTSATGVVARTGG
jgi:hypothetical protein